MSVIMRLFLVVFLLTGIFSANAQATANFTASVTIVEPISIKNTSDLNFASIDAKSGGLVTIAPNNTRSASGGIELKDATGVSAATFEVKGQKGFTYTVTLPKHEQVLTNGSETIIIKDFVSDFSTGSLAEGSQTVRVGATLDIKSNQHPGVYKSLGAIPVTVNYN